MAGLVAVDRSAPSGPGSTRSLVRSAPEPDGSRDGVDRAPGPRDAAEIARTARAFLDAYLPPAGDRPGPLARLARSGVTDPALATRLLGAHQHTRQGKPGRERVVRVDVERLSVSIAAALAHVTGPHGHYAVALTVRRRGDLWIVIDTRSGG